MRRDSSSVTSDASTVRSATDLPKTSRLPKRIADAEILFIEDTLDVLEALRRRLSLEGYRATFAASHEVAPARDIIDPMRATAIAARVESREDADAKRTHPIIEDRGEHIPIERIALARLDTGAVFEASGARVAIGSASECDVVIDDPTVSRWHCELAVRDHAVVVADLGSSNGTTVNDVRIERAFLEHGCTIGLGRVRLRFEIAQEPVRLPISPSTSFGALVGEAPASRAAFALLERAATSNATVLLVGETGTGKEVAARSLHEKSARRDGAFVVVDCASIPSELLESELFGHARGAFTGAIADRIGAFAAANGGTIFLDEVGELPLHLQPKLLRALEARAIKPVGTHDYRDVDVRVVAATHRELTAEVSAGRFRSDLYYRLAVLEIRLPALRERIVDLPLIIDRLLLELAASPERGALIRRPEFLADAARRAWPGNVRELRNHIERAIALGKHSTPALPLPRESDEPSIDLALSLREARERWTRDLERRYIAALLDTHDGNVSAAARSAGIDRKHLHRLIAKLDL
jgi:DNA-binding NtrC family response regulator